jgi:hypothetical protein
VLPSFFGIFTVSFQECFPRFLSLPLVRVFLGGGDISRVVCTQQCHSIPCLRWIFVVRRGRCKGIHHEIPIKICSWWSEMTLYLQFLGFRYNLQQSSWPTHLSFFFLHLWSCASTAHRKWVCALGWLKYVNNASGLASKNISWVSEKNWARASASVRQFLLTCFFI